MDNSELAEKKILIVEDSKTQLKLVSDYLQSYGATVIEAVNVEDGLLKAKEQRPEIIISDIEMPKMNGYEFCRKLKDDSELNGIPVILLTNLSDPMDVIKGIECGADNFLTKPCSSDRLIASIHESLANSKINRNISTPPEVEFSYRGMHHKMRVSQNQVIDLLLSTYSNAMEKTTELEKINRKLSILYVEFQKKNEELTRIVNDKNLLLGMAAHDLRNPLNAIQNYSELVQMKIPADADESVLRMIKTIGKSSKFMLMLVNDLLSISAVEFGKLKLNIQKNNIVELVENNCKLNQSLAEQKEMEIKLNIDKTIPEICFDANKLEQVINNLINNAIKYSHPGSCVEVSLRKESSNVVLQVKDEGIGIPENDTANMFEIFTTGGKNGTSGELSTGLGLAIVKRIIDEHHGKISVESTLGKGSTFFVSLPCVFSTDDFELLNAVKNEKSDLPSNPEKSLIE